MCGILGTVNRPFGENVLNLLRHRGPDDSAIAQLSIGGHLVTLGHRRLSILDLSPAGRQPMYTSGTQGPDPPGPVSRPFGYRNYPQLPCPPWRPIGGAV
jgi:hypothetical protein